MLKSALLFILFFLFSFPSLAAPCYGTKLPAKGELFGGVESYVIAKKSLESGYGKVRSNQHFFKLSYGVYDWFSIDLKGGAGSVKQHPIGSDEADYPSSFAGGYGFRLGLYNNHPLKVVLGFQHISVHPEYIHLGEIKNKAILDDWQVSLLASYGFLKFTPYAGIKWARVDYIHWVEEERKRKMSDLTETIGIACGLDLFLSERIWLNLEGQFLGGECIAASVNFKF